ncbi:MAG: glycosyltransferase [Pseudohongiella sp.]|nr:glycosyltransferase [Pseudohongiella sp.]
MSTENSANNKALVSIICRTIGRPELQQALKSVNSQSYPNIEIVLVNAATKTLSGYQAYAGDTPVTLIATGQPLTRSEAANAGLHAAKGQYLMFLDDDDWIANDHVQTLMEFLGNQNEVLAAYSSTQKTDVDGNPIDYVFEENFDPVLLMRDNYIPIHAMLFERSLLDHGCHFDEAFDIYEDWDFWLQLSQHTEFRHIDKITAFYREGGDSDTAVENVQLRYQSDNYLGKGRAAIFGKWLTHWSGEKLNELIGHLDQSLIVTEQAKHIQQELEKNADLLHQIDNRNSVIDQLTLQLNNRVLQIEALQQHAKEQTKQLDAQAKQAEVQAKQAEVQAKQAEVQGRHISMLESTLSVIYSSPGWKLMGPFRRLRRFISPSSKQAADKTEADL